MLGFRVLACPLLAPCLGLSGITLDLCLMVGKSGKSVIYGHEMSWVWQSFDASQHTAAFPLSPNLVSPKQRVSLGVFLPFDVDLGLLRSVPAGSAFIAVFLFWESRLIVGWNETATSFSLHPP